MTISFDIETRGLKVTDEFRVGFATGLEEPVWDIAVFAEYLMQALIEGKTIACHNVWAFDLPVLIKQYPKSQEVFDKHKSQILDTAVASRLLTGNVTGNSMQALAEKLQMQSKAKVEDFATASDEVLDVRIRGDVKIQEALTKLFVEQANIFTSVHSTYFKYVPMFYTFSLVNVYGLPMDEKMVAESSVRVTKLLKEKRSIIDKYLPSLDNLRSAQQIHDALLKHGFEGLPLGEPSEKTQKRSRLFNQKVQDKLCAKNPFLEHIFEYRDLTKQEEFFVRKEGSKKSLTMFARDGRIYPDIFIFSQRGHRTSFRKPPLNQLDSRVRFVIAEKGKQFIGVDLVSLEWNIFAHALKIHFNDTTLLKEIDQGLCPKQKTLDAYGELFSVFPEEKRLSKAKTFNYANIYGQGLNSSCDFFGLEKTKSNKQILINKEKLRYPAKTMLKEKLEKQFNKMGYIRNLLGEKVKPEADYICLNQFIQSSGSCWGYVYLGHLSTYYRSVGAVPVMFNHDEVQFTARKSPHNVNMFEKLKNEAEASFEEVTGLPLYTVGDLTIGNSWGESH